MAKVELLRRQGFEFDVIAVITDAHIAEPDRVFRFFHDLAPRSLGLNVEEAEGAHDDSSLRRRDYGEVVAFFRRMLDLQIASGGRPDIREFRQLHWIRRHGLPPAWPHAAAKSMTATPFKMFNFAVDGAFTTYCPELLGVDAPGYGHFVMGDIVTENLDAIRQNPLFQAAKQKIDAGVERCKRDCGVWLLCGGGSPGNKLFEHGSFDAAETEYCRMHKKAVVDAFFSRFGVSA
jgi:uncharacterized protein